MYQIGNKSPVHRNKQYKLLNYDLLAPYEELRLRAGTKKALIYCLSFARRSVSKWMMEGFWLL